MAAVMKSSTSPAPPRPLAPRQREQRAAFPSRLIAEHRLRAIQSYKRAIASMGEAAVLVLPVIIGGRDGAELSVEAVAKRLGRNPKKDLTEFREGLDRLADHYQVGRARR